MKCIRNRVTREIERVCEEIAQDRVRKGDAEFVPKHEWREYKAKQQAPVAVKR